METKTCQNCKHWKRICPEHSYGECENNAKIHENFHQTTDEADHLIYSYYEGGNFSTGKDFGCVHFAEL